MKRTFPAQFMQWRRQPVLAVAACMLALSCMAQAQESPLGATIANQGTAQGVPACASCHGAGGEGNAAAGFPRLAGASAAYLEAQLNAFANEQRPSPVMAPFAKMMAPAQRTAVAEYFSRLPSPALCPESADAAPSDTGAWLATRGRWEQGLPACAQCHGPGGVGVGVVFPPLAGQPASYVSAQLHAWQKGQRPPGPLALMPAIASKLSDADIAAVSDYYAGKTVAGNGKSVGEAKQ